MGMEARTKSRSRRENPSARSLRSSTTPQRMMRTTRCAATAALRCHRPRPAETRRRVGVLAVTLAHTAAAVLHEEKQLLVAARCRTARTLYHPRRSTEEGGAMDGAAV
jgi:hypothetical protein